MSKKSALSSPSSPSSPSPPPEYKELDVVKNCNLQLENLLEGYEMFLLFDQSGSMSGPVSKKNFGITRWQSLKEVATTISTTIDHIDSNGATVVFFNTEISMFDNRRATDIEELFANRKPGGLTNLAGALNETFNYLRREFKKNNSYKALIIVVTDGVPYVGENSNECDTVAKIIADFTREMKMLNLTDDQVGISIIQIGDDPNATKYLKFLDDKLTIPQSEFGFGAVFDIVDTINFEDVEASGGIVQAYVRAFTD